MTTTELGLPQSVVEQVINPTEAAKKAVFFENGTTHVPFSAEVIYQHPARTPESAVGTTVQAALAARGGPTPVIDSDGAQLFWHAEHHWVRKGPEEGTWYVKDEDGEDGLVSLIGEQPIA